ncbi:hypothetical protein B0T24DRAFT_725068 [Lasiosphaeria ovina]|uniref:Chromatin target of PRMT1 protein C-terminal domain-containing protein n=1 Tax=Lasiosphaeria ovina TaxID=92902 RepID=A0AAE0JTR5_9PEZI|nr:hypothetical protein B0T24DRAFT_725068 [Lasiosphaeria ovina]
MAWGIDNRPVKSAANINHGAGAAKGAAGATRGVGKKGTRGRGGRNGRPAKKTTEELDSEMADYCAAPLLPTIQLGGAFT